MSKSKKKKPSAAAKAKKPEETKKPVEETAETPDAPAAQPDSADAALDSFLNRSQEPKKGGDSPKKRRINSSLIVLALGVIAVTVLILIAIKVSKKPPVTPISDDDLPELPAEIATTVDEKGEHHVEIATDEEGEIKQNGYGELISYVPAQIKRIDVENAAGSFTVLSQTPQGEATVYTLVGFEDYDLQPGTADSVANDAASVSFSSVVTVDGSLDDFGLKNPRATVNVTYTDDTTAVIRVGNTADGGAGTYVTFGDDNVVFLVSDDAVDSFLFNVLDMINHQITPAADSVENSNFSLIEIGGSHYKNPITLVPNTDEAFRFSYALTSPYEMFADSYEGSEISGSIRDLYAESVVCVNPNGGQLSSYGLSDPYVTVRAVYPDIEISLSCSAPDGDGLVHLYYPDKSIIYSIRADALGWAGTDLDQLLPKTVIDLNKAAISRMVVTTGSKTHTFNLNTTVKTVDDTEVVDTEAEFDAKRITEDDFNIFFQDFNGMSNLGLPDSSGSNVIYDMKISYTTGRADDDVAVYDTGDKSCPVALNGKLIGSVSKSHVSDMQKEIADLEQKIAKR